MVKTKAAAPARKAVRKRSTAKVSKKTKANLKVAALSAGALAAGKASYSTAKFVAKAGLVVAAAAAAAAFIPKSMQREMADAISEAAHTALERAKSLKG